MAQPIQQVLGVADLTTLRKLSATSVPVRVDNGLYFTYDTGTGETLGRWAIYLASSTQAESENVLIPLDDLDVPQPLDGRWHLFDIGSLLLPNFLEVDPLTYTPTKANQVVFANNELYRTTGTNPGDLVSYLSGGSGGGSGGGSLAITHTIDTSATDATGITSGQIRFNATTSDNTDIIYIHNIDSAGLSWTTRFRESFSGSQDSDDRWSPFFTISTPTGTARYYITRVIDQSTYHELRLFPYDTTSFSWVNGDSATFSPPDPDAQQSVGLRYQIDTLTDDDLLLPSFAGQVNLLTFSFSDLDGILVNFDDYWDRVFNEFSQGQWWIFITSEKSPMWGMFEIDTIEDIGGGYRIEFQGSNDVFGNLDFLQSAYGNMRIMAYRMGTLGPGGIGGGTSLRFSTAFDFDLDNNRADVLSLDPTAAITITTFAPLNSQTSYQYTVINRNGTNTITVNNPSAVSVGTIGPNETKRILCDGVDWYVS